MGNIKKLVSSTKCTIYCTGDISINELRNKLADLVGSDKIEMSFIEKEFYEISVRSNDEFDINRQINFPDGFLYFKFIIDVGFEANCEIDKCVYEISKIVEWLWQRGMPAVVSCDYENLLPMRGGYNSKLTPWPAR